MDIINKSATLGSSMRSYITQKLHRVFVVSASALARFVTLCLPFKVYRPWLGNYCGNRQFCTLVNRRQIARAIRCGRFVERICDKVPWEAKCLVGAMVMRIYCWYYQLPYVMYLGMAKETDEDKALSKPLLAHAWLQVGSAVVTGREGHKAFTIVASFSNSGI